MKSTNGIRDIGNIMISGSILTFITSLVFYVAGKIMNGSVPIIETYMFKYITAD